MPKLMKISTTQFTNWGKKLVLLPVIEVVDPFIIEIDTTLGNGFNSFQIPTRLGYVYDMEVEVSDGQYFNISAWDQAETLIQFASAGVYTIKIRGYCGSWYDNNTSDVLKYTYCNGFGDLEFGSCESMFHGAANLDFACNDGPNMPTGTSMYRFCRDSGIANIPAKILDRVTNVTNLVGFMYGCVNLTGSAPSLDNVPLVTNLLAFMYGCYNLTGSAPSLDNVPNVTNLTAFMYGCVNLTGSAPSLDNVPLVTNLNAFMYGCYNLTGQAPSLDNVPNVTNLTDFMYGCVNLTLPVNLFDLTKISIVTDWTNMLAISDISNSHTGTLQPIWDYASPTATGKSTAFLNNTNLTNYTQLRIEWP